MIPKLTMQQRLAAVESICARLKTSLRSPSSRTRQVVDWLLHSLTPTPIASALAGCCDASAIASSRDRLNGMLDLGLLRIVANGGSSLAVTLTTCCRMQRRSHQDAGG